MELIDKGGLKEMLCLKDLIQMNASVDSRIVDKMIDSAPTIEAVPVVRCKDCKFYPDGEGTTKWEPCCDMITPPNWYCADGVAKMDGEE